MACLEGEAWQGQGAEPLQHQGQRPRPKPAVLFGTIFWATFFQGFSTSLGAGGGDSACGLPQLRATRIPKNSRSLFTETLSFVFACKRRKGTLSGGLSSRPGLLAPLHRVCKNVGAGQGRENGRVRGQPACPSALAPTLRTVWPGAEPPAHLPSAPVVMATGEARHAIGPLPATPPRHRFL